MFAKPDENDSPASAGRQPADPGLSLLSRTGPEVPPDVTANLQPEFAATRQPETTAASKPDLGAMRQPNLTATPHPDGTAAHQPNLAAIQQPNLTATPHPDGTAARQPNPAATPQSGVTATPGPNFAAARQPAVTATPQAGATANPQGTTANPQRTDATAPQPDSTAVRQAGVTAPPTATPQPADPHSCLVESTETLPIVTAASRKPPAPSVAARAVIVYETPPRRPWRLWVFTAVLVALTIGVVLGQAAAWQPVSRTASVAEAQVVPTPSAPTRPGPGLQLTAPLGSTRTRLLEVTGAAAVVHIRSMDLGSTLFHATAFDGSAVPSWADTGKGTRLDLVRTGAPGTAGLDIQLNTRVSWTIRLTAGTTEQDVDMRAGGLGSLQLTGGHSLMALRLPKPTGTVPLYIGGTVSRLSMAADTGTLVRLRLTKPAGVVTVDEVKQLTSVTTPAGWPSAKNRYDLSSYAIIGSLAVTHR